MTLKTLNELDEKIFGEGKICDIVAEPAAIIMFIQHLFNITDEELK